MVRTKSQGRTSTGALVENSKCSNSVPMCVSRSQDVGKPRVLVVGAGGSFQLVCGNDVKWPGKIVQTLGPLGREIQRRLFKLGAEQGSLGLLCNLLGSHVAPFLELQPSN